MTATANYRVFGDPVNLSTALVYQLQQFKEVGCRILSIPFNGNKSVSIDKNVNNL